MEKPKNICIIVFDDLNDWLSIYQRRSGMYTPNFERLARKGLVFDLAFCPAPVCNSSRAATFLGRHPIDTEILGNSTPLRDQCEDLTVFELFQLAGVETYGIGKIFHDGSGETWQSYVRRPGEQLPPRFGKRPSMWTHFQHTQAPDGGITPPARGLLGQFANPDDTSAALSTDDAQTDYPDYTAANIYGIDAGIDRKFEVFDWGSPDLSEHSYPDRQNVERATDHLSNLKGRFCLTLGIHHPHLPWYTPERFFDLYRDIPEHPTEDRNAPLAAVANWARKHVEQQDYHRRLVEAGLWGDAVRAYCASVSYADEMLGLFLDALDRHPEADDTLVVVMTDHGWHLGEMHHWGKSILWERAAKVPLIFSGPGVRHGRSKAVVSLVDIAPTLIDVFELPARRHLPGKSLVPLLRDPTQITDRCALTSLRGHSHTVRTERWRYIRYRNGEEELYDHAADEREVCNLAAESEFEDTRQRLRRRLDREIKRMSAPSRPTDAIRL